MRYFALILFLLAIFLINAHSIRVGEEDRRIWAPLVLALLAMVTMLRMPMLLRCDRRILTSPPILLFGLYLLWLGVSQFWSVAPGEGKSHILVLCVTMLAVMSLSDQPPYRTALAFLGCMVVVFLASWAGALAGQEWVLGKGSTWRLKGVMMHQQTLALVTIAGLIIATVWYLNRKTCTLPTHRTKIIVFVLVAILTLLATKGRSLSAFSVLTLFLAFFFHIRGPARIWVLVAGVTLGAGLYVAVDIILPLISRGQEETLSGRLIVWELTIDEIAKRPLLGFGFGTYQDYFYRLWNNWAPGHAHNLWLQVTFESGIVGVVLYSLFLIAVLERGYRFYRQTGLLSYSFCLAFFCLLGGATSVFIGEKLSTIYGLLLLFVVQEERLRVIALDLARDRSLPDSLPQPQSA